MRGRIIGVRLPLFDVERQQDHQDLTQPGATARTVVPHGPRRAYFVLRLRVPQPVANLIDGLVLGNAPARLRLGPLEPPIRHRGHE